MELGVHISFALSVTTNISSRSKYFMWGGVGVAALISILVFSKAIFMCRYTKTSQDIDINYDFINNSNKKLSSENKYFKK